MRSRLRNGWTNITDSFWFVPSVLVALALLVSSVLIEIDATLIEHQHPLRPWLFGGTADAARSTLSTIAGSLITVVSIAFSLTMLALQQASSQFSPRVLRRFTADRANQVVLGAYITTFTYALLVLRQVRSADESGSAFVPSLSVTFAIGLALVCMALLIYFIHHISQALQVDVVAHQIHAEMVVRLDALYPSMLGHATEDERPAERVVEQLRHADDCWVVRSTEAGFVRSIDEDSLLVAPLQTVRWMWIRPRIGAYVSYNSVLAELSGGGADKEPLTEAIRQAFVVDATRTLDQDLLFGMRQLADIALKALSPGINDPTTAEHALRQLGDVLGRLGQRQFPATVRTAPEDSTRLLLSRPTWDDFVAAALDQIRREARDDLHVTATLLEVLDALAQQIPSWQRTQAVQRQVAAVRRALEQPSWSVDETHELLQTIERIEHTLRERLPAPAQR